MMLYFILAAAICLVLILKLFVLNKCSRRTKLIGDFGAAFYDVYLMVFAVDKEKNYI